MMIVFLTNSGYVPYIWMRLLHILLIPSQHGQMTKKEKVRFHFQTFNLAERFSKKAVFIINLIKSNKNSKVNGMNKDMFESSNT